MSSSQHAQGSAETNRLGAPKVMVVFLYGYLKTWSLVLKVQDDVKFFYFCLSHFTALIGDRPKC